MEFDSLYIDAGMTGTILSPPLQAILDLDQMTLSGTLSQGGAVVVPSGLFYAPGSIILRHPDAQLILEPGARIIFAKHASIRVDYGVLKVLGDENDPVILAPVLNFTTEYGNSKIENSTVWDGIYFGPDSNETELSEGNNLYISGSIISHCKIYFGGYYTKGASVHQDEVSVLMKEVTIFGDFSRYVNGIEIYNPNTPVYLDGVSVRNAGSNGIYIRYADEGALISKADVHGCRYKGVRIEYSGSTTLVSSRIHSNLDDQVYVYDNSGMFMCK